MQQTSSEPSLRAQFAEEIPAIAAAIRHPWPFFITGLCAIWAGYHTGQNPQLVITYTLFAYVLSLLALVDLKQGILPHILTGTLITLGTLLAPSLGITYWDSLIGGAVAFASLGAMALLTMFLTGKGALGGGDLYLVLGLGTWLGMSGLPMLLVATAVTGTLSIFIKRILTANLPTYNALGVQQAQFPFGPALCAAGWLALLYSPIYWQVIESFVSPVQ